MIPRPTKNDYIDFHSHHQEQENGVFRIYNQLISNKEEPYFTGFRSIGLHPWDIEDYNFPEKLDEILTEQIANDYTLFIGECGLDKNIPATIQKQEEIFFKHIKLSEKVSKPLIIHCVKAHQELIALKRKLNPKQKWIIHGFNGSPELAGDLIAKGFKFSVGHSLLLNPEKAKKVLNRISVENLFFETDDSDVSIQDIYDGVAVHLQLDEHLLRRSIFDNFIELFQNDK